MNWRRNGISSIQCCSSRDDASGKICQHTIEFKKHGVSKILYVKSDADSSNVGEITKVTDNLFTAVIDRFADYSRANEYSREGWQAIINNAVVVM